MNYSHKDFTGRNLTAHKIEPQVIRGSCFSQETPDSVVFPADMTGVTFEYCNLDNCVIPAGNTVIGGSQRRFQVQNDLNDWEIDEQNIPLCLVNYLHLYKQGIIHPAPGEIPDAPVKDRIQWEDPVRNVRA